MCGISGSVGYELDVIDKMARHQHKRGPDNTGFYYSNKVALAHNRLSIIDLSKSGNQPMTVGKWTLVYNGEIYNYKQLQGYVHADDDLATVRMGNDAWTLLHYIGQFGIEKALQDANGMYAYCAFDAELQQIHLVTDRFGQKPLYYCHSGASFVFASSVGAILQTRDKWKIDEEGLQSYWLLGAPMGEHTMISGIQKLTGSHHLVYDIRKNQVNVRRYWTPQFQENTSGIEDLILDAIDKVKVSDVQPFVFLSGGIDSTLVASRFRQGAAVHLNGPEYKYAWEVREKFNLNMAVVDPQDINVTESLEDYAFQVGEPAMAALIPYITSKEVGKFAKVAISANGADELFFGYDRTTQEVSMKQYDHVWRRSLFQGIPPGFWMNGIDDRVSSGRWFELQTYVQFDLNRTLDAAAMCHSLEVRSPFLDHRLVEMALSIPYEKHVDPKLGRKAILKRMLQKTGFSHEFLTRPKLGFSLHREPEGMENLKLAAWTFVKNNGFLKCDDRKLSGRDERYLKMAALSFWIWCKTWEYKL